MQRLASRAVLLCLLSHAAALNFRKPGRVASKHAEKSSVKFTAPTKALPVTETVQSHFQKAARLVKAIEPRKLQRLVKAAATAKSSTRRVASSSPISIPAASTKAKAKIPWQLVQTAKTTLSNLPEDVQENHRKMLAMNPGLNVRWLSDDDCSSYIKKHYNGELVGIFKREKRGSFRGDICRAAVLAREGGFYMDLDVQMRVPLNELADNKTTFMSVWTADDAILNALMASVPGGAVMSEVLHQLVRWYNFATLQHPLVDDMSTSGWMGPLTALRALRRVEQRECKSAHLLRLEGTPELEWSCGKEVFRLYRERKLDCGNPEECPPARESSSFEGEKYGIFEPKGKLVAWPRFESCSDWGCSTGGWITSFIQLLPTTVLRLVEQIS